MLIDVTPYQPFRLRPRNSLLKLLEISWWLPQRRWPTCPDSGR